MGSTIKPEQAGGHATNERIGEKMMKIEIANGRAYPLQPRFRKGDQRDRGQKMGTRQGMLECA